MSDARRTADVLIEKARGDEAAASALAERAEIPEAIVGFHAQQAVEKALKAVLSARDVPYEFRHDIAYLCELLADDGVELPDKVAEADVLTPWAAEFRYEDPPSEEPLDRPDAVRLASTVIVWAEQQLRS
jgi:HEPN domain-containing protein